MPDFIGNIEVPEIIASGTFPIVSDFPHGRAHEPLIVVHQFGSGNAKIEQRFLLGTGAKRFTVQRSAMTLDEWGDLRDFWDNHYGPYGAFTYNAPNDDGAGTTAYTCRFANEPISFEMLSGVVISSGITLIEIPSGTPEYTLNSTLQRFPSASLKTALLSQVQEIIPLVKIQPREMDYDTIYLSDRRCQVGTQLYQARLMDCAGISQSMGNEADEAQFLFGNADRVMRDLANDVDLFRASIEFSLFHVGTGIKLDLWKGDVIDWSMDAGPDFQVTAADGLYELNLPYPTRRISRTCWKQFNDGNGCPFASKGSLDLIHFPTASPTVCDKGYDTSNGCLAHKMKHYFGGVVVDPQGVRIKDNSTGTWGFGRSSLTSVSLVSESIYDQVIPEVYTDSVMPVNCKLAAGRDESDFYNALGIVGEGPLTLYGKGHKVDEQYHHGYPGTLGLREIRGTDPAGTTDFFSLGQSGNQTGGDWRKVYSGSSTYRDNFSAGTAFLELRRSDEKGLQLSRPGDHSMQAIVSQGLKGWVWSGAGSRTEQVLTNPIWIAINMILRARGLRYASAATCEAYFDVDAAIAAAAICNDSVTKLVGSGTETQFKFRGALQEEKPLRDWIQEVLMNALGFYSFAFGKCKFGIRVNSSVVEAFSLGNILFNSLQLSPLKPSFNHITANFADSEFEFASNSISLYDIDHAKLIGGATTPLYIKANLNLSGTASKSQAARIITTRLREELGGLNATEWKKARQLSFKTTILALNTEPGMVCSMTHPDMPGGAGEFRVTSWRLNKDYSIDIEGRTTTDGMYDLVEGPKPADVTVDPFPGTFRDLLPRPPFGWLPYQVAPLASDPLWDETEYTFGLTPVYDTAADGTAIALLRITGKLPVNTFSSIRPPVLNKTVAIATTGGSLQGGKTYYACICAKDGAGKFSQTSEIVKADVPAGTNTNKLTVTADNWTDGAEGGYAVFAGEDRDRLSWQADATGTPATIVIAGPLKVAYWGVPDTEFDRLRLNVKRIFHSGVFGQQVGAVTTNTITVAGATFTANQWAGYTCSILAIYNSTDPLPILNYNVVSNTADTLTLALGHDPSADGVKLGDVIIMRAKPSTVTANTIGDANFQNCFHPSGANPDEEIGRLIRIIAGTGRGQVKKVIDNTATIWTIEGEWDVLPDATSIFIVEEAKWETRTESTPVATVNPLLPVNMDVRVDNLLHETVLVQAVSIDGGGHAALDEDSPVREIYLFGSGGSFIRDLYIRVLDENNPLETGNDITNTRYRLLIDEGTRVDLIEWGATLKTPSSSGNVEIDLKRSSNDGADWTSILTGGKITISSGTYKATGTSFAITTLNRNDWLRYDVLSAGSGAAGLELAIRSALMMIG